MATKKFSQPGDLAEVGSAISEIKRQLEQGYALISAVRVQLVEFSADTDSVPDTLLDMAGDVIGDFEPA